MTAHRDFHDGRSDGLIPLESLDLDKVTSFAGLLRGMAKTAFSGRSLGEALDVTLGMVRDPDCKVVLTLSGAMTIAKMGKVIAKMIDTGMVQAVVSTGALMAHGLSEAVGMVHYRHDPRVSDEELFDKGYNRVYDTLEMEANLNYVEEFASKALDGLEGEPVLSSEIVNRALGRVLAADPERRGRAPKRLLEAGAGLRARLHRLRARPRPLDLGHEEGAGQGRLGSDGASRPRAALQPVPRPQQLRPLRPRGEAARHLHHRRGRAPQLGPGSRAPTWTSRTTGWGSSSCRRATTTRCASAPSPCTGAGSPAAPIPRASPGASSCPQAEGGRFAEVFADATTVWPLLIKGVLEELGER